MSNAKENAKELVNKYYSLITGMGVNFISKLIVLPSGDSNYETAKQCALITVDEMLEYTKRIVISSLTICTPEGCYRDKQVHYDNYLLEVKEEIKKI